ncbi:efflux RND transporter permease subunit [Bacterioplanoides sp.]|uniref:efflux RND transporter permease subunit n=1 Tax=Bacterioplanoides sp. TaxID=2066072 RepID=UPI003AFFCA57
MKQLWLNAIIRHPWLTILMVLLLGVAATLGAKNLHFRGDYKVFFEKDFPQLVAFEEMQRLFNKNDNVSIIVVPKEGTVFAADMMAQIKELTDEAWQIPYSNRVDSISNYQHTWAEEDDLIVEDLILELDMISPPVLDRAQQVSTTEPLLVNRLVSENGQVAVINITVQLPDKENNTLEVIEITEFTKQLTEQFSEKYQTADFYHTGVILMNYSFATEAQKDLTTLIPLMFLAIILMLAVLLRSLLGMLSTLVVILLTIASTMGLSGWLGYFLSTATINVPIVVMTLAVADCVHIVASTQFAMRQGKSREEAVAFAMELNLMPVFITSATTAIGFITLMFSESPVLADFGELCAIGVMLAFVFSVTILPALLRILPIKVAVAPEHQGGMERFGDWVVKHHKALLPVTGVVMFGFAALVPQNQLNDEATKYFDPSTTFRQSVDKQEELISGMSSINWALYSDQSNGISDPDFLQTVEDFSNWLRQQPEVDHVATISDTIKRLNKSMNADDESYYRLPGERELTAQYLLMYEMSLPYGLDLNNQLNIDKSSTQIVSTLKNLGSKEYVELEQRALQWFDTHAPDYRLAGSGPTLMFSHIGETNMNSMIISMVVAMFLISALLVFALKSTRLGAISLIPNVMPAAVGFGVWALISGEINLGLSIVVSMTLGIIVDDTVHFLSKYQRARVDGRDTEAAIRYAFSSVGRALVITTLVLCVGFSLLTLSAFRMNADMGLATALIIFIALLVDFLFLPAFLLVADKRELSSAASSSETSSGESISHS